VTGPHRWRAFTVAAVILASLAGVAWLPWEWSLIDDTQLLGAVQRSADEHGPFLAVWHVAAGYADADPEWGLFRPAFYLYVPLFYQLPVGVAHAVRVAMLGVVFAGAAVLAARGSTGRQRFAFVTWALCTVAADRAVYAGIWYPSLQELSGLCFVGLGMLAYRRPWVVVAAWTVAVWFKSPFCWLLLAYGLLLTLRRDSRMPGLVAVVLAAGSLGTAATVAVTGSYTNDLASLDLATMVDKLILSVDLLDAAGLVVLLGALLIAVQPFWRWRPPSPIEDPFPYAMLAGGAGYLANLLVWRTDSYYAGPYVYLLSVGGLLLLRQVEVRQAEGSQVEVRKVAPVLRVGVALAVVLAVSAYSASLAVQTGWRAHQTVTGLRDCILALPADADIGYNRKEGAPRLNEIVRQYAPDRPGRVVWVANGQGAVETVDYYAHEPAYGPGTPALLAGQAVCVTPDATVYRVS
jgi:hypothetical protein